MCKLSMLLECDFLPLDVWDPPCSPRAWWRRCCRWSRATPSAIAWCSRTRHSWICRTQAEHQQSPGSTLKGINIDLKKVIKNSQGWIACCSQVSWILFLLFPCPLRQLLHVNHTRTVSDIFLKNEANVLEIIYNWPQNERNFLISFHSVPKIDQNNM